MSPLCVRGAIFLPFVVSKSIGDQELNQYPVGLEKQMFQILDSSCFKQLERSDWSAPTDRSGIQ